MTTATKDNIPMLKDRFRLTQLEDEMLEVIEQRDDFTTSDLQGIVSALLFRAYTLGKESK